MNADNEEKVQLETLREDIDDAKMFTSEMHDPYVRTTGAWK